MIKSKELKKYLDFAYKAYQENNISEPDQTYRQDGKVPYIMHPLWCASMLIADTQITWEQRELGFKVLILHDVLEDTSLKLPEWVEMKVVDMIKELTFKNSDEALEKILSKPKFIKLLGLYDALSGMYENHVNLQRRSKWKEAVAILIKEVEKEYGNIRIVQVGKAITENTNW